MRNLISTKGMTAEEINRLRIMLSIGQSIADSVTVVTREDEFGMALDGTVLTWESEQTSGKTLFCAKFFNGRQIQPSNRYSLCYASADQRSAAIDRFFGDIISYNNYKAQQKAQRHANRAAAKSAYSVGDVLYTSTGYSMTYVEFWRVIAVNGARVTVQKLFNRTVDGDLGYSGHVVASDVLADELPAVCMAAKADSLKIKGEKHAYRWDGRPLYFNHMD